MAGKTSFLYVKIARPTTPAYNSAAMQNDAPKACHAVPWPNCAAMTLDAAGGAAGGAPGLYRAGGPAQNGRDQVPMPPIESGGQGDCRRRRRVSPIAEPVWRSDRSVRAHQFARDRGHVACRSSTRGSHLAFGQCWLAASPMAKAPTPTRRALDGVGDFAPALARRALRQDDAAAGPPIRSTWPSNSRRISAFSSCRRRCSGRDGRDRRAGRPWRTSRE